MKPIEAEEAKRLFNESPCPIVVPVPYNATLVSVVFEPKEYPDYLGGPAFAAKVLSDIHLEKEEVEELISMASEVLKVAGFTTGKIVSMSSYKEN